MIGTACFDLPNGLPAGDPGEGETPINRIEGVTPIRAGDWLQLGPYSAAPEGDSVLSSMIPQRLCPMSRGHAFRLSIRLGSE